MDRRHVEVKVGPIKNQQTLTSSHPLGKTHS